VEKNTKQLRYRGMIAPCGMNCGLCIGHLRYRNPCSGCLGSNDTNKPDGCKSCTVVTCELLAKTESGFCYECLKYPCRRLKTLDKRYKTKYGMSMFENLALIKANGLEDFLISEEKKWTCPNCGSGLSVHRDNCLNCGFKYR
jgi:hypothetical protein